MIRRWLKYHQKKSSSTKLSSFWCVECVVILFMLFFSFFATHDLTVIYIRFRTSLVVMTASHFAFCLLLNDCKLECVCDMFMRLLQSIVRVQLIIHYNIYYILYIAKPFPPIVDACVFVCWMGNLFGSKSNKQRKTSSKYAFYFYTHSLTHYIYFCCCYFSRSN